MAAQWQMGLQPRLKSKVTARMIPKIVVEPNYLQMVAKLKTRPKANFIDKESRQPFLSNESKNHRHNENNQGQAKKVIVCQTSQA